MPFGGITCKGAMARVVLAVSIINVYRVCGKLTQCPVGMSGWSTDGCRNSS